MNTILLYLLMTPLFTGDSTPGYTAENAYQDSLNIFNHYAYEIGYLKNARETDTATWNARAIKTHAANCPIQKNLTRYNHGVEYLPIDSLKRPGCETAYKYLKPFGLKKVNGIVVVNNEPENIRNPKLDHIFYDEQTRFAKNHKPYILRIRFNNGELILQEKLKPVPNPDGTYSPLEE